MKEIFNYEIFHFGNYTLTVSKIISVLALAIVCWLIYQLSKKIIYRLKKLNKGQTFTTLTILKYFLIVFFVSVALKLLGIDISVFIVGSAALLVGIGLGMKDLFYDFISGIILLAEGTIKVGNVIQIGDKRVEILVIRFRTSVVKTREEKEIIVPNSFLTKNEIINWSNQKNINRHFIEVHVNDKDVEKAIQLIQQVIKLHLKVSPNPEPYVRIEEFTDYSVSLRALFWSDEVFAVGRMLGEIRLLILKSFQKNNIVMPLPHQVVTLNK